MQFFKVRLLLLCIAIFIGYQSMESYSHSTLGYKVLPLMRLSCNDDSLSQSVIPSITIGNQIWMAKNLAMYTDEGSWYYNNSCEFSDPNGRLYYWETVMNCEEHSDAVPSGVQGLCPNGWHIPSAAEWDILINYLSAQGLNANDLKSTENPFFGTNSTGFNSIPTGTVFGGVGSETFANIDFSAVYLTSSLNDNPIAPIGVRIAENSSRATNYVPVGWTNGWSVRCVKDACGNCPEPDNPIIRELCLDCNGVVNGTAMLDDCGECLEPSDPAYNQSCIDCAGTPNGAAIIDECGICLDPVDPEFNQSCADCAGTINGTAVIDDCGECIEPTNPNFNQSCIDCAGVPNGISIIDDCGECLEPSDPDFDQSCADCNGVINGVAMIDDCGECLELSDPAYNQSCIDCAGVINGTSLLNQCGICLEIDDVNFNQPCNDDIYVPNIFTPVANNPNNVFRLFAPDIGVTIIDEFYIYDRWGNLIYESKNFSIDDNSKWWDGTINDVPAAIGVYTYLINFTPSSGNVQKYFGNVTILR